MGASPESLLGVAVRADAAASPFPLDEPVAVVDLGSNSARVIVVERPVPGVLHTIAEKRLDLRLATALDGDNALSPQGVEAAIDAVAQFAAFARESGACSITVVATAAVRAARNRDELLTRARAELGITIEALIGAEEAELAAVGALRGLPILSGVAVDIGGGSTEVARVIAGAVVGAWSFPLGALSASAPV